VVWALTAYAGVFGAAILVAAWLSRGGLPGERRREFAGSQAPPTAASSARAIRPRAWRGERR